MDIGNYARVSSIRNAILTGVYGSNSEEAYLALKMAISDFLINNPQLDADDLVSIPAYIRLGTILQERLESIKHVRYAVVTLEVDIVEIVFNNGKGYIYKYAQKDIEIYSINDMSISNDIDEEIISVMTEFLEEYKFFNNESVETPKSPDIVQVY